MKRRPTILQHKWKKKWKSGEKKDRKKMDNIHIYLKSTYIIIVQQNQKNIKIIGTEIEMIFAPLKLHMFNSSSYC